MSFRYFIKRLPLTFLFLTGSFISYGQTPISMKVDMEMGPFGSGYKTIHAYDVSRHPLPDQAIGGNVTNGNTKAPGRQMQIHVWYPAVPPRAKANAMLFKEYVWELSREIDFQELTPQQRTLGEKKFLDFVLKEMESKVDEKNILQLLNATTGAIRDAKPATGRFPMLLVSNWRTPAVDNILAEYLSTHGFVIVSTSLKGTDSTLPEISTRGISSQANDFSFVLAEISKLPFVDTDKIAMMGTGINATTCLAYMTEHGKVQAFISLDGGILSNSEKEFLLTMPSYEPTLFTSPMLFIYSPHQSILPANAGEFKYAPRELVQFPLTSEFYYLNFGLFEKFVPGILGKAPKKVTDSFNWSARIVKEYLNTTLYNRPKDDFYSAVKSIPDSLKITSETKAALPTPLNLHELKIFLSENPPDSLIGLYNKNKAINPQPYTTRLMGDLFTWLGFQRDDDLTKRAALIAIWLDSYPNSARGNFLAARILSLKGNTSLARIQYRKALECLPLDDDFYLSNSARQRIKDAATQALR